MKGEKMKNKKLGFLSLIVSVLFFCIAISWFFSDDFIYIKKQEINQVKSFYQKKLL